MYSLDKILRDAAALGAADIFIVSGSPVSCRRGRGFTPLGEERVLPDTSEALIREIYAAASRSIDRLFETGDDDFSFAVPQLSRFRVSTYRQRGSLAAVIRVIPFGIPSAAEMNIPESVMGAADLTKGLVLVTGPAGSGKSTTLACIIDRINRTRADHIVTLEEPIEYLFRNEKSIISQREISLDSESYITALRACLRQSPDVILLGEMRDYETIQTAMTAAETGHLVISTLHTVGAVNTIDRIIDVFPPAQQQQIRVQLSMVLRSVISQQLVPAKDGGVLPAFEIMHLTGAVKNMIREAKTHQIDSVIAAGAAEGMVAMDASLAALVHSGKVEWDAAARLALNPDTFEKRLASLR